MTVESGCSSEDLEELVYLQIEDPSAGSAAECASTAASEAAS